MAITLVYITQCERPAYAALLKMTQDLGKDRGAAMKELVVRCSEMACLGRIIRVDELLRS
jgi:hypothetical protein